MTFPNAAPLLGAFIGEVLVVELDDSWATDEAGDLGVQFKNGALAHPHSRAHERLTLGQDASLAFYYSVLSELVAKQGR